MIKVKCLQTMYKKSNVPRILEPLSSVYVYEINLYLKNSENGPEITL